MVLLCAGWVLTAAGADSLHFLVVGDTGSGLEPQKHVAEAMARHAAQNSGTNAVNFVLMVGDNFYDNGVISVDDPQWQDKFEVMYDAKRLSMPFFAVLGNHDWKNEHPDVQIEYARAHPGTRWQMDGHWFKREFPSDSADTNAPPFADIFLIDTEAFNTTNSHVAHYPDKKLGEEEMAWLEKQLQESRARWKIVVAHHPLYSDGEHGHDKQVLELRARLEPLFKQWKVDAFITGHDHDLQRIEVPGTPTLFLISGSGSKLRTGFTKEWQPFHAAVPGFAAIKLSGTEMRGEFLDADGKVLDAWHRPPLSAAGK
ncbi:MAG: Acid phosphatase [Pedosphaera sp.]|nr:Acid phosphatase [Pedosphaera sp.]